MVIRFLGVVAVALISSFALNCGPYEPSGMSRDATLTKTPYSTPSPRDDVRVSIKSIEFYAWLNDEGSEKPASDEKKPSHKLTYIKLDRWEDTSKAAVPHPDRLDVVCQVENKGSGTLDLIVSATGDWIIAPRSRYSAKDLDRIADEVSWTEEREIGREVVRNLAPGEAREVKIKDFILREMVKRYTSSGTDNLWPWKFRAHIYIEKWTGERIAQKEAVLPLLPSDANASY